MNISFYTIDDLSLGYDPKGVTGYRLSQFLCLEDALLHYRDLSASKQKALGLTDGTHVLPLVECCRLSGSTGEMWSPLSSATASTPSPGSGGATLVSIWQSQQAHPSAPPCRER